MALIKLTTLPSGETGDYWKITSVNSHALHGSDCTIQLYKSKALRQANADPTSFYLQFHFTPGEIEAFDADENLPNGWRDVYYHVHYLAIKAAAVSGYNNPNPTDNEKKAQVLYGSQDDI